jgi:hypothetical protein
MPHGTWYQTCEFDSRRNEVRLSTGRREARIAGRSIDLGLQEFYTFDADTGAIVEQRTVGAWVVWAYGAGVVVSVVCATLLFRWLLRRWRMRAVVRSRGFPVG